VLPLWDDCIVGEVVSGFQGPEPQGSACELFLNALDPLGSGNSASSSTALSSVMAIGFRSFADPPRVREASLFVFGSPLPMVFLLFPHIVFEAFQVVPLVKGWVREVGWGVRSSLLCLETVPKSPPKIVDRALKIVSKLPWMKIV
jgi:hypothetical protein